MYLLQPNGAEPIPCSAYEGYGKWGDGEDQVNIYEWLAVLNFGDAKYEREAIHADCENKKRLKYPLKFVSNPALKYEDVAASESCQYQGFFYPDEYSEIS